MSPEQRPNLVSLPPRARVSRARRAFRVTRGAVSEGAGVQVNTTTNKQLPGQKEGWVECQAWPKFELRTTFQCTGAPPYLHSWN